MIYSSYKLEQNKNISYLIKLQISISCIIHNATYIFPAQDRGFIEEDSKSKVPFLCSLETGLFSLSLFNENSFSTILSFVTYISMINPDKMYQNEYWLKWVLSLLCWSFSAVLSIYVVLYTKKKLEMI